MAEQVVELAPGESKVVSFEATPSQARTYQVVVNGLVGSFVASPRPVAKFEYVSDLRLTYLYHTNYNAAYRLEVDVQNIGDAFGTCHCEIMSQVGLRDDPVGEWLPPDSAWMLDGTQPYRDLALAPGQIGTVSGIVMWHWQLWQQWIISGDAGKILSAIY